MFYYMCIYDPRRDNYVELLCTNTYIGALPNKAPNL